jgi:hypothetical protein
MSEVQILHRCGECAFTKGTEANKARMTQVAVELCLQAGEPFYCHAQGEPMPLCAGFVEARKNRPPEIGWKRDLASALLEVQEIAQISEEACRMVNENFADCVEYILEEQALERWHPERADETASR